MDFAAALDALAGGHRVIRPYNTPALELETTMTYVYQSMRVGPDAWRGERSWMMHRRVVECNATSPPYPFTSVPYSFKPADIAATDWEIFP